MSYQPIRNDDSLSELFSCINDFYLILKHLLASRGNMESFDIWLHKCLQVNGNGLYLFLRKNRDRFSESEWQSCARLLPLLDERRYDINEYLV